MRTEDRASLPLAAEHVMVGPDHDSAAPTVEVTIPPDALVRAVFGGLPAAVLARLPGVESPAAEVLAALFPRRLPYIYRSDRFYRRIAAVELATTHRSGR